MESYDPEDLFQKILLLEKFGMLRTIIDMNQFPQGYSKSRIRNFNKSYQSAEEILQTLIEEQIITTKESTTLKFILTKKGKLIADLLTEIALIMNDSHYFPKITPIEEDPIETAFKLLLSPALLETWESDWDGSHGTDQQHIRKNRIKKIALKYIDSKPEFYNIFKKRFLI